MKTLLIITITFLCLLSSCKKENKTTANCTKNMEAISGTYSLLKLEVQGMNNTSFDDISGNLQACELDDKLILNPNGTSVRQFLGKGCMPPLVGSGNWSISSDNKMTINDHGSASDILDADITSFDCSTLVLTGTEPMASSAKYRLTLKKSS